MQNEQRKSNYIGSFTKKHNHNRKVPVKLAMESSVNKKPNVKPKQPRRVSSSELIDRSLDYDLDLNALDIKEQVHPHEPLFNEFKFTEDLRPNTLKGLKSKTKKRIFFEKNDP